MNATFWDHLGELRKTLLRSVIFLFFSSIFSFFFSKELVQFLLLPLMSSNLQIEWVLLTPLEGILTCLKVTLLTGIFISLPYFLYEIFQFIAPALKDAEKNWTIPFLFFSYILIPIGIGIALFLTIPLSNSYLYDFNQSFGKNLWSLHEYISYTLILMIAHSIALEICLILLFMVHYQIVSSNALASKRKHAIVLSYILGALFTPPDVPSQIILGTFLWGMYEMAILYAKFRERLILKRVMN